MADSPLNSSGQSQLEAETPRQKRKLSKHAKDVVDHWVLNLASKGGGFTFTIRVTAYKNGAALVLRDDDPNRWKEKHAEEWFGATSQASAADNAANMIAELFDRALAQAAYLSDLPASPASEN